MNENFIFANIGLFIAIFCKIFAINCEIILFLYKKFIHLKLRILKK